jgi:hypothetical protein
MLFHAEADRQLVDIWLDEPTMAAEAEQVLGKEAAHRLRADADVAQRELLDASDAMFAAFAAQLDAHAGAPVAGGSTP